VPRRFLICFDILDDSTAVVYYIQFSSMPFRSVSCPDAGYLMSLAGRNTMIPVHFARKASEDTSVYMHVVGAEV
jgi:hypothetical protein